MRVMLTFGADYPEHMRSVFDELLKATHAGAISGLTKDDLIDALESASDFSIIDVELVD